MIAILMAMVLGVAAIAGVVVVLQPIARALADRIGGRGRGTERRLAVLETVVADLRDDHELVGLLVERVERAERSLGTPAIRRRGKPARQRPPPAPPAADRQPRAGKLWTPPPYEA